MAERLSKAGLARFADVAARQVGDDQVPGLVAVVACGEQVHIEVLGSLAIGGPPVRPDTLFRISSNTKPVTAVATLALAADGLLDVDESVDRLLPELRDRRVLRRIDGPLDDTVPAHRPVTVRDLLTFTFGFGMTMEMFQAAEPWPVVAASERLQLSTMGPPNPDGQAEPDRWIAGLGSLPLLAQPGERWLYNTGASVLGVLLARAAGVPFPEVLRRWVFEPLGMRDTAFWTDEASRLPTAYLPGPEGLQVWDSPDGMWNRPPAFPDGAAGLVSTADDLLALARMLLRGGEPVLPAASVAEMTQDQLTPEQRRSGEALLGGAGWGFGQAVVISGERAGAFGWSGGLGTTWHVDPVRDLAVIVLTQRMFGSPQAPRLHLELQDAAYAALA